MVEKPVPEPGLPYGRNDEFESQKRLIPLSQVARYVV
jgi:hypothetical protein